MVCAERHIGLHFVSTSTAWAQGSTHDLKIVRAANSGSNTRCVRGFTVIRGPKLVADDEPVASSRSGSCQRYLVLEVAKAVSIPPSPGRLEAESLRMVSGVV
jgi:hypothetical protein